MSGSQSPYNASAFRELCKQARGRLHERMLFEHDPNLRFAPTGTATDVLNSNLLQDLFSAVGVPEDGRLDVNILVNEVERRKLQDVVAVMVYANIDEQGFKSFFKEILVPPDQDQRPDGLILPWASPLALEVFQQDADTARFFLDFQPIFSALVLKESEAMHGEPGDRLPYIAEPKELGEGSFGRVFCVRIAPRHVRTAQGALYEDERLLARKDYQLQSGGWQEREKDVMKAIVSNRSKHDNILENFCSVQIGSTYSLFMDLADCDLKVFMENKQPSGPSNSNEKAGIIYQAAGLASGLHFLHHGLKTEHFEQLSCFHMDLKPSNILVVRRNGQTRWMLSDFNMSKVKVKAKIHSEDDHVQLEDDATDFNRPFRRRGDKGETATTEATASTVNLARDGTYLSPEACDYIPKRKNVRTESDTWSLGCVLSVVFSYILGGAHTVREFRVQRSRNRDNDQFFSLKNQKLNPFRSSSREKVADRVNEAIKPWFDQLVNWTKEKHDKEESQELQSMLDFLLKKVLIVDPDKRKDTTAENVERRLAKTGRVYGNLLATAGESLTSLTTRTSTLSPRRTPTTAIARGSAPGQVEYWDVEGLKGVDQCQISPDGRSVFYMTQSSIEAYSLVRLCEAHSPQELVMIGSDNFKIGNTRSQKIAVSNHHAIVLPQQPQTQVSA